MENIPTIDAVVEGDHKTPEWGSIADAQKISGNESRSGIYRAIARGELIAAKRGRRTVIDLASARRRACSFPLATLKNMEG